MIVTQIIPVKKGLAIIKLLPAPTNKLVDAEYDKSGENILIDKEILLRCEITEGSELSDEDLNQLVYVSQSFRAKQRAIWYLSFSDYSEKKLYEKLLKNFPPKAAAFAVAKMCERGYVNDRKFAMSYLKKSDMENYSAIAVKKKLYEKGISSLLADEVMEEVNYYSGEQLRAKRLILAKYKTRLSTPEEISKVIQAMQRRGFVFADIKKALEDL